MGQVFGFCLFAAKDLFGVFFCLFAWSSFGLINGLSFFCGRHCCLT